MEIPNLINKLTGDKNNREYFFALEINSHSVRSAIWAIFNEKTQVISTGSLSVWQGKDAEDLITAADNTISVCVQNFKGPMDEPPKKVVFGLPENWVDNEKIISSHQPLLKKLTQKLELEPVGFVVTTEAIVHHLKITEGVPPSIILIGLNDLDIDVTLVKLGLIKGTQNVGRSVSLGADLEEGLSRFNESDLLPSRILLYDGSSDLEEAKQQLLDHPWTEKLPFLHFPKVEILPADFSVRAVAISGGTEFAKASMPASSIEQNIPSPSVNYVAQVEDVTDDAPKSTISQPEDQLSDLGFVADSDIIAMPQENIDPVEEHTSVHEPSLPEQKKRFNLKLSLPKIRLPKLSFPKFSLKTPKLITGTIVKPRHNFAPIFVAIPLLLVLSAIGIGLFWYVPKASVAITVEPKTLDKRLEIIVDPNIETPQQENKAIPAKSLTLEVSGDKTVATTGQKTVGDKALGEVTIYNATPQTKSFTTGTILTSPGGLKFTLANDVQVASKSGNAKSSESGVATVKIVAASIGENYNLSSNTEFKIGSFSKEDIMAQNLSPLAGGTSRQIQSVAKSDLDILRSQLQEELGTKAKQNLNEKLESGQHIIDSTLSIESSSVNFDKKVGDEANSISLSLSLKATALVFDTSDLAAVAESDLTSSLPTGYLYRKDQLESKFEKKDSKDNRLVFSVSLEATLLPRISIEEVAKNISGKPLSQAENYFKTLPGYVGAQIIVNPKFIPNLPYLSKNIDISVKSH